MKKIGIRDLKNRLSRYVREAQAGYQIAVTDRGRTVAELLPPRRAGRGSELRQQLADLERRGLATLGAPNDPTVYKRLRRVAPAGTSKRLLDDVRGDR